MIATCGIMGTGWFVGIIIGAFVFGPFVSLGVYMIAEDWWTHRQLRQYGGAPTAIKED
jgi:hypothetical protein